MKESEDGKRGKRKREEKKRSRRKTVEHAATV